MTMTKNAVYRPLAGLALLALSAKLSAQQPVIHLVTEHLPPYQVVAQDGHVTGFATEIMQEVFKLSKIKYDITAYSWARSYNLALKKPDHCIYSIARIPARENKFQWIGKITETNNAVLWGLKGHSPKIESLQDIRKYTTAVSRNDVTHLAMLERGFSEGKELYVLENTKPLLNLLVQKPEIDFIIADDITIGYRAKLAGVDVNQLQRAYEFKDLPLEFYLACSLSTDGATVKQLQQTIQQIHNDGTYQHLLDRWQQRLSHLMPNSTNHH